MTSLEEELMQSAEDSKRLRWFALEFEENGWNFDLLRSKLETIDGFSPEMMPKKIMSEYVGSPDVATHICSAEKSAELFHIQSYPVWEDSDFIPDAILEAAQAFASEADHEPVDYFGWHVYRNVDVKKSSGDGYKFIGATGLDDIEAFEDLLEHERCNPSF